LNKYLACTAAVMMPMLAIAQPAATGTAPMAPMAHSTMAPAAAPAPATGGMAATTGTTKLSAMDKKFIMKAAQGGMAEVQLAQLAQQKSQDDTVKKFAQQMIDDHTPANAKLTELATAKGDTPPSDLDAMDQKMMTKLQALDGKKFDTAYMKGQLKAHKAMLKLFKDEAKKGTDPDLKSFADSTEPTVEKHIDMAKGS
jgi:putative membrane protein